MHASPLAPPSHVMGYTSLAMSSRSTRCGRPALDCWSASPGLSFERCVVHGVSCKGGAAALISCSRQGGPTKRIDQRPPSSLHGLQLHTRCSNPLQ